MLQSEASIRATSHDLSATKQLLKHLPFNCSLDAYKSYNQIIFFGLNV